MRHPRRGARRELIFIALDHTDLFAANGNPHSNCRGLLIGIAFFFGVSLFVFVEQIRTDPRK